MAKYKVLRKFIDKETKELYEVNDEIELTIKRAKEVSSKLDDAKGNYLERLDNKSSEVNGDD